MHSMILKNINDKSALSIAENRGEDERRINLFITGPEFIKITDESPNRSPIVILETSQFFLSTEQVEDEIGFYRVEISA